MSPSDAKAHFRTGTAHANLGQLDEARESLLRAAKLAPGDGSIRTELERVKGLGDAIKAKERAMFGGVFNKK